MWDKADDPYCGSIEEEEEYLRCYARTWSFTVYHPVGTCAMGSVTDSRLRVQGLQGLRSADIERIDPRFFTATLLL